MTTVPLFVGSESRSTSQNLGLDIFEKMISISTFWKAWPGIAA